MRVNPNSSPIQSTNTAESQAAKKSERLKHDHNEARARSVETTSNGSANAEISSRAKEMAAAKQVASDSPDVREAKIAALREQIASKKYNVSADAIADRLVDDHLKMGGA
ncbi:MAG: flagellar biosynthesis anti-sigma factor FlgM [Bdellovibrionales bacterium]|nr:flagellar biosynthesis anti-sigma factor FlgM [Bdellovibrionales bacterium]